MKQSVLVTLLLALVVSVGGWLLGMSLADGAFTYPLDDTYIHLAIARNLAVNGTWGFEAGVPVFASSSPLWTVLLAIGCLVSGSAEWLPLVLSYIFGIGSLVVVSRFWDEAGVSRPVMLVAGIAFVLFVPFITLANLGMEHALHVFCITSFLYFAWRCRRDPGAFNCVWLLVFTLLSAGARYESLFVITPVALLLGCSAEAAARKRIGIAASVFAVQFIPVVLMGIYSVSCGRPFLPVSLMLKANVDGGEMFDGIVSLYSAISAQTAHYHVLVLLLLVAAAVRKSAFCAALAVAALGHGVLAKLGWMYRYEAYLVACGIMMLTVVWGNGLSGRSGEKNDPVSRYSWLLLVLLVLTPFLYRSFNAHFDTIVAQKEINAQQKQMGRIFEGLPPDRRGPIAVNDLGCVALYSGVHILDLWGLGSPDVAELSMKGMYTLESVRDLVRNNRVRYYAIHERRLGYLAAVPGFVNVATLSLVDKPVVSAGDKVSLGVIDPADAPAFAEYLKSFAPRLPGNAKMEIHDITGGAAQ